MKKLSVRKVFCSAFAFVLASCLGTAGVHQDGAAAEPTGVSYQVHVQNTGWQDWAYDGQEAGTTGQSLRLEAIRILLDVPEGGGIEYKTHVQDIGWMDWVSDGADSGTTGQARRLEAIEIRLTGAAAKIYDIYYCVHAQNFGWMGWAKNGAPAGTAGYAYRLEAIKIQLVTKGGTAPGSVSKSFVDKNAQIHVTYQTHVQDIGWMDWVSDGATSGTTGQGKRVEAIRIKLANAPQGAGVSYEVYVQGKGWLSAVSDGNTAGTIGQGLRIEAIKISLVNLSDYSIEYRVHMQNYGWMSWTKNGAQAGATGHDLRIEAIEIRLVVPTTYTLKSIGDVIGTPKAGVELTAGAPDPGSATVTYQWQIREGADGTFADISGATAEIYTPPVADVGKYLRVKAVGIGDYAGTVYSAVTSAVANADQTAPTGIGKTDETIDGRNDGIITGVNSTMEYKLSGTADYIPVSGSTVTGLADGTYLVRYKAKTGYDPSPDISVTINPGAVNTYTLVVDAPTFAAITYGDAQPAAKSITITCTGNTDATISSVTVTGNFTIGGSGTTVAHGYSITSWTVRPNSGLAAGTYTGTITVTYNAGATATDQVSITVNPVQMTAIGSISGTAKVGAELTAGSYTPSAATVTYQWKVCDTVEGTYINISGATANKYTPAIADAGKYIKVSVTGTGNYGGTVTSTATSAVANADQAAPAGIGKTDETVNGRNDGTITGVDSTMEYKISGAASYSAISGTTITGLSDGTYLVRYKAKAGYNASPDTSVTINPGTANTYTLAVTAPTFAAITYGDAQPAAQKITIASSGNTNSTISNVTVTGNFTIGGSGSTVPYGTSIDTWTVCPNADLAAGTQTGTITVTYNAGAQATAQVSIVVNKKALTGIGSISGTPKVGLVLTAGTLTPSGATAAYQWKICDTPDGTYSDISGATSAAYTPVAANAGKYLKVSATGSVNYSGTVTSTATAAVALGDQAAPAGIGKTDETVEGRNDGTITGVDSTMEYKISGAASYSAISGTTVTGLPDGTYLVRYKAKTGYNPSPDTSVTILPGSTNTYTLTVTVPTFNAITYGDAQPAAKSMTIANTGNSDSTITSVAVTGDFTIGGSGTTVPYASSISTWTVRPNAGLAAGTHTGTITVTYNAGAQATAQVSIVVNAKTITIAAIPGVTVPVLGETPVSTLPGTSEYSSTITWSPADSTFREYTQYSASITITPKTNYTLTGVSSNFFTVAGASAINTANSGAVTAVFPKTADVTDPYITEWSSTVYTNGTTSLKVYIYDTLSGINISAVHLYLNSTEVSFTYQAITNGYELTHSTTTLAEGTYTVKVDAADNDGNEISGRIVGSLVVDYTKPSLSVSGNPVAWQNTDVTLTVTSTDTLSGLAQNPYSFDGGTTWQSDNFKTYTANTSGIVIKVRDNAGNIQTSNIDITKIDKGAPIITSVSGNPTAWQNTDATLSVSASDSLSGLAASAYSFDGGSTWQAGNTKTYAANTPGIIIKVRDAAGNVTAADSISITKIDKTLPTVVSVTGNPTFWQKTDVTLTVNGAADGESGLAATPYSFDNGTTWQADAFKTYTANAAGIIIKLRDAAGNIRALEPIDVTYIDKSEPNVASVTGNPTAWQKTDVTLTVNAADSQSGLAGEAYSFDNGTTWQAGSTKTYTANTSGIIIKVRDIVGNMETMAAIDITKIDKTAPTATSVTGNPTEWQNTDVTLTVNGAADSASGLASEAYSFDNGATWQAGNTKTYAANTAGIIIKVRDAAGNVLTVGTIDITKIDKTAPTAASVTGNPIEWQNTDVTLTVNGAADSASGLASAPYSFDNGATWQAENTKTYAANTAGIIIKVRDAAGNVLTVGTIDITYIDKDPPTFVSVTGYPEDAAVEVTVTVNDAADTASGLAAEPYSFDNGATWQTGNSKSFTSNQTVYIRIRDTAGNFTETTFDITNIV